MPISAAWLLMALTIAKPTSAKPTRIAVNTTSGCQPVKDAGTRAIPIAENPHPLVPAEQEWSAAKETT